MPFPMTTLQCSCSTHALAVEELEDYPGEVTLSIWQHGYQVDSWWSRLRGVWQILRRGHPYADFIILDSAERLRLWHLLAPPTHTWVGTSDTHTSTASDVQVTYANGRAS